MNLKIALFALLFAAIIAFAPQSAQASAATKVDLLQDRSAGGLEAIDMDGPSGYGFVNFNQNNAGDLKLLVSLKDAQPNTTYEGVFLVCGPTHATACGFVDVGTLTTNASGNGNAIMWLDVESLQEPPFGSGSRTDHFDLLGPDGDVYAATGVDYLVP